MIEKAKIEISKEILQTIALPPGYSIIYEATILRECWEMDNKMWVLDTPQGRVLVTTNHGKPYVSDIEELKKEIKEHSTALQSLKKAKKLMNIVNCDKP